MSIIHELKDLMENLEHSEFDDAMRNVLRRHKGAWEILGSESYGEVTPAFEDMLVDRELLQYCESVSFEDYCSWLDGEELHEGLLTKFKETFSKFLGDLKSVADALSLSWKEVVRVFKDRKIFGLLKAFGFSLLAILRSLNAFAKLVRGGLMDVFKEISDSKIMEKVRSGAMKVDDVIAKYPILKKVGGVVVAGLLVYAWLNMTFIGDLDYDFDLSTVAAALAGNWSIHQTLLGQDGLMTAALLILGMTTGISIPWLGSTVKNLAIALIYTAAKRYKNNSMAQKLKGFIERKKLSRSTV